MIWLAAALFVLAGVRTIRWWQKRVDVLGRVSAFPWITVGLLAVLGTVAASLVLLHDRTEDRLSAASSAIAGTRVRVHCQSLGGASVDPGPELGYVRFDANGVPEHSTLIKWETCRRLSAWLRSDKAHPTRDELIAVHVLTHETMHMTGTTDEAITECHAMQHDAAMARTLGATSAQARQLAVGYWLEVYPQMPDAYRTPNCVPGGALDEHLPDPPWA